MLLVYVPVDAKGRPEPRVDCATFEDHANALEDVLRAWHGFGQPECWLFSEVGRAPWHSAAGTVRISSSKV